MGSEIGDALSKEGLDVIAFEKNIARVHAARAKLCPVYVGDANRNATLEAARLDRALCAVVTIDDTQSSKAIVRSIRQKNASIPIIVRAHNREDVAVFVQMEGVHPVPEHLLVSGKLTETTLQYCGYRPGEAQQG